MLLAAIAALSAQPIIDVHRHATFASQDHAADFAQQFNEMDAYGVVHSIVALNDYEQVRQWHEAGNGRLTLGAMIACPDAGQSLRCWQISGGWADISWLEKEVGAGRINALHEVAPNYLGIAASDAKFAPYFALAARYDIPVGVHTQSGPPPSRGPRRDPACCPDFDGAMGNPAFLRPVMEKHPTLRVWIQHVGSDFPGGIYWDETLALLRDFPNVYVDLTITNAMLEQRHYEVVLAQLIGAGMGDRIMFGSDGVPLQRILPRLQAVDWLSETQRRAILYENAARFFRLDD